MNKYIKNYLVLTICLLVSAINFNLLIKPINLVCGGTPGLAIIIEHVFNIPISVFMPISYVVLFVLSYFLLGKNDTIGILYATILYPLFVNLTENITSIILINYQDMLIITIISAIISGISNGFIYKLGFASSGLGVVGPIFNKYFKLSISLSNFIINAIIVVLGGYYFGIEMVLYAVIMLYLSNIIVNKVILGISSNKAIYIRSDNNIKNIISYLYDFTGLKPTIMDTSDGKNMIFVIVPVIQYNLVIRKIKEIDNNVFYSVCDTYELGK